MKTLQNYWRWVKEPPGAVPLDEFLDVLISANRAIENVERPFRLQKEFNRKFDLEQEKVMEMIRNNAPKEKIDKQTAKVELLINNYPDGKSFHLSDLTSMALPYFHYSVLLLLRTLGVFVLYALLIFGIFYILF